MKKSIFAAVVACFLMLTSCGADQTTVDAMSNDMCVMMEKYNPEDPMSMLAIIEDLGKLQEKEGYNSVTEAQLNEAMEKSCPEGKKKLQSIMDMAN